MKRFISFQRNLSYYARKKWVIPGSLVYLMCHISVYSTKQWKYKPENSSWGIYWQQFKEQALEWWQPWSVWSLLLGLVAQSPDSRGSKWTFQFIIWWCVNEEQDSCGRNTTWIKTELHHTGAKDLRVDPVGKRFACIMHISETYSTLEPLDKDEIILDSWWSVPKMFSLSNRWKKGRTLDVLPLYHIQGYRWPRHYFHFILIT